MTQLYSQRVARLLEAMTVHGLEAVILLPGPNMLYYTGLSFHLMGRPTLAVFTPDMAPLLFVGDLERAKAEGCSLAPQVVTYGEDMASRQAAFKEVEKRIGLSRRRTGVEPLRMRWMEQQALLEASPGVRLTSAEEALEPLRAVKSADELASIERAIEIAESALQAFVPSVRAGVTERDLASELSLQLLRAGSEPELPFFPIVASGPNAALPHAVPTLRRLQRGDLLIVDWGATVEGLISDLTRTFSLGDVEPEFQRIHNIVAEANAAGRNAVQPGAPCRAVDHAARAVIEAAGYGPAFLHRTGHGIGLEAHEPPYLRSDNEARLAEGMTFTVEPGIYLEGRGGVRIEDNLVVTPQGGRTLSHLPRDLVSLG
ncbi:MAG TPA: Xaa-Pro peptidase family protein [Anaerolineales bacterium]|nr:Xaa-Pro peptidase family protein [Anaerolineales bacterium]